MIKFSEPKIKNLKKCTCYTATKVLHSLDEIQEFILESAKVCKKLNPKIKCPKKDYCFGTFLDNKVNLNNFTYKYCQAVTKPGKQNKLIKFETLPKIKVLCLEYTGPYHKFKKVYKSIFKWLKHHSISILDVTGPIREVYIDGPWNQDNPYNYKTEFQIPVNNSINI